MIQVIPFFAIGALGFYLAVVVVYVLTVIALETEHEFFSGVLTLALLWYFANLGYNILAAIAVNPGRAVLYFLGYIVAGWASVYPKWYGLVSDYLEDCEDNHHPENIAAPQPSQYKSRIIGWVVYWPWSMTWFLVRHPMRRIGKAVYDVAEKSLIHMSNSMTERLKTKLTVKRADAISMRGR